MSNYDAPVSPLHAAAAATRGRAGTSGDVEHGRAWSEPVERHTMTSAPADSAGKQRKMSFGTMFGSPRHSPDGRAPRSPRMRRSSSLNEDEFPPAMEMLPRASRRNLQRQKRVLVVEMHADGRRSRTFLRMREVQQLLQAAVPKPRRRASVMTGADGKPQRRAHNVLHPRDLRSIDTSNPTACKNPSIVVRQHVIVCNLAPIRCVVVWDRLVVLMPSDDPDLGEALVEQLETLLYAGDPNAESVDDRSSCLDDDRSSTSPASSPPPPPVDDVSQKSEASSPTPAPPRECSTGSLTDIVADDYFRQPFELRALEAVLQTCTLRLDEACEAVEGPAEASMRMMQSKLSAAPALPLENLERLRHVKNGVSHLEARARDTAEALTTLLDEDEDMCMMRLSLLRERPRLFDPPISPELLTQHEDVELLLESYLQETEAVQTRLELLRLRIDNAEDLFAMKLDLARNRLITADTIFTLVSMCLAAGAVIGGFFGMNLHQDKSSFLIVALSTAVGMAFLTFIVMFVLVKTGTLVVM